MNKSDDIKALAIALCLAQSEFENAKKTSKNPFFNSKYASLEEVLATVKPILNSHDMSVLQFPSLCADQVLVETVLLHKSGQWISEHSGTAVPRIPADKQLKELMPLATTEESARILMGTLCSADAQLVGKAISYLRRYSLLAICGIAQEDDDGEGLAGRPLKEGKGLSVPEQKPVAHPEREAAQLYEQLPDGMLPGKLYFIMLELIIAKKVPEEKQREWLSSAKVSKLCYLKVKTALAIIKMLEKQ